MNWFHFAVRASFLGGLLFSILLSSNILYLYARRAVQGSKEQRWLGRHITAIAASHLSLLAWATARFITNYAAWSWPWAVTLGAIILLSDWSLWQIHLYRRFRDAKTAAQATPAAAAREPSLDQPYRNGLLAVVLTACILFILWKLGWFNP